MGRILYNIMVTLNDLKLELENKEKEVDNLLTKGGCGECIFKYGKWLLCHYCIIKLQKLRAEIKYLKLGIQACENERQIFIEYLEEQNKEFNFQFLSKDNNLRWLNKRKIKNLKSQLNSHCLTMGSEATSEKSFVTSGERPAQIQNELNKDYKEQ